MALQTINNGSFDFDPSAEKVRISFDKVKAMFSEIYGKVPFALTGQNGKTIVVNASGTAFELVPLAGGGDMLGSNNLSEITNKAIARFNLGIDDIFDPSNYATSEQGTKADNAIQVLQAGAGITLNPIIDGFEIVAADGSEEYLDQATFDPATRVLTLTLLGGGKITLDMSPYTVLNIDGYQVKKGPGKTDYTSIEVTDKCRGWEGDNDVAFTVTGLPYTDPGNRNYSTNNAPSL